MNASQLEWLTGIDRSYRHGRVISSGMFIRIEHRNDGWGDLPAMYIHEWHERIRWALISLQWAVIGAQMLVERVG